MKKQIFAIIVAPGTSVIINPSQTSAQGVVASEQPTDDRRRPGMMQFVSCHRNLALLTVLALLIIFGASTSSAQSLPACGKGYEKSGALCYPECKAGYNGVGPVCWEVCPDGFTNDGATCRKNAHIVARFLWPRRGLGLGLRQQ